MQFIRHSLCPSVPFSSLHNHKNRRHVNDLNNRNGHRTIASGSQLSIEVSDLTKTHNGRLEITCLATIPAHVGPGEQFADYKTSSVKGKCFS